jgi:outer membrane protein, multidrug efflux system
LQLAQANRSSFLHNLETLEQRYQAGLLPAYELRLFRAQSASYDAAVASAQMHAAQTIRQLQAISGHYADGKLELPEGLPAIPGMTTPDLPAELLLRRPDLRASERMLAAAAGNQSSVSKNRWPSLRISGSYGSTASAWADLLSAGHWVQSIAAHLTSTIWAGGRLAAERDLAQAQVEEQAQLYVQAVLDAFAEVEIALSLESLIARLEADLTRAESELAASSEQAWELYLGGLMDITTVLESERRLNSTRSELLGSRMQRLMNRIELFVALGGNWNTRSLDYPKPSSLTLSSTLTL